MIMSFLFIAVIYLSYFMIYFIIESVFVMYYLWGMILLEIDKLSNKLGNKHNQDK